MRPVSVFFSHLQLNTYTIYKLYVCDAIEGLSSVPIMIDILLWFVWLKHKMIVIFVAIKRLEADVATMKISLDCIYLIVADCNRTNHRTKDKIDLKWIALRSSTEMNENTMLLNFAKMTVLGLLTTVFGITTHFLLTINCSF